MISSIKKELSESDQEKFTRAQKFSEEGDTQSTMEIMEELVSSNPDSGVLRAILANSYSNLGDLDKAEKEFKKAVKLKPDSEKVSLGLFHCLWRQGKKAEALDETKRFMSISYSKDYEEIVKEINEKMT